MTPWSSSRKRSAVKNWGESGQSDSLRYTTLWYVVKQFFAPAGGPEKIVANYFILIRFRGCF
jgi:hypothetical protein